MNTLFYINLFLFGTIFGSFASIIIYKLRISEEPKLVGKNHYGKCYKILKKIDLVPILGWLINRQKCKYCKKKIDSIYSILEISMGIVFCLIGYFLIDFSLILKLDLIELSKLIFWLFIGFVTILYTFYDIIFLEINEGFMLSSIIAVFLILGIQTFGVKIIDFLPVGNNLVLGIKSIFISAIIFGLLYTIMLKGLHEIWDIMILLICFCLIIFFGDNNIAIIKGVTGALFLFSLFFLQIIISKGTWMGGGDLRIAILVGMLLGIHLSIIGFFMTYLVGSIIGLLIIIRGKMKNGIKTKLDTQIPFGPFLAIGFFITVFFREDIIKFIDFYL